MKVTGEVNTARGDYDPLEDGPVVAARPNRYNELSNLVRAEPRQGEVLPPMRMNTNLSVNHPANQQIVLHTGALDRAKGFQWMITPISFVVATLALIVSLFFSNELFSLVSLLIFWGSFCLVYLAGWALTAVMSAEFVSLFSAWRQWNVIDREQTERWAHYRGQTGPVVNPWHIEFKGLIVAGVILSIVGFIALTGWAMLLWG